MAINDLTPAEFESLFGAWAPRTPQQVAEAFDGYAGTWWVAGGWSLEAFTGVSRAHEDIDVCVLSTELAMLRRHFAGKAHLWAAGGGAVKPVLPDDRPDASVAELLDPQFTQLWTRQHALAPWEFDLLLTPSHGDDWIYKRDDRLRGPLRLVTWEQDGVRYQNPEITLLFKARLARDKDHADLASTLPRLDERQRIWLTRALDLTEPDHPWLSMVAAI